jgi:uncharacterized protein YdiU (UPF0061 family)
MRTLEELSFDNTYQQLPQTFYSRLAPTPLSGAFLVSFNPEAAALLDLHPAEGARRELVEYLSGMRTLPGSAPVAMCYSGHQFGHYVARLGDGRAILLGEVRNARGEKWDLHLKGAGQTPYSRQGDGRAVLRSSLREYLCGEAMHGLGIPSSRGLCVIGSTEEVYREAIEPGAMLVRLAPTHVRFGSFEYFYYSHQFEQLKQLADHVIAEHYPALTDSEHRYTGLLRETTLRTARLIAQWQAAGFAHGVMNTDNMSILGLTLDYGPFGFLDQYDPGYVCNHSDHQGRYAFDQQPRIGLFNLSCLAQALLPLLPGDTQAAAQTARAVLELYQPALAAHYTGLMRAKLGLQEARADDQKLCADLLDILATNRVDYTRFFRALARFRQDAADNPVLRDLFADRTAFAAWSERYRRRLAGEHSRDGQRAARMDSVNPKYILRNYLAETAIRRAQDHGDYAETERLLALLRRPYDEQPENEHYAAEPPDWAQRIAVSCSS